MQDLHLQYLHKTEFKDTPVKQNSCFFYSSKHFVVNLSKEKVKSKS